MRKHIIAGLMVGAAVVALPTTAFAASSAHTSRAKSPTVTFVLRGALSNYTAASSSGNGTVTITVASSNFEGKMLKGQSLTFSVGPKTRVTLHDGKPVANGDKGIVKVRAQKDATATDLQSDTPFQVIDQGTGATGATGTTGTTTKKSPTVTFVLRGTLSNYTAASSSGNGTVTITVASSNFEGKMLKGQSLTFSVGPKTRVILHEGKPVANGDKGIVKVRAQKDATATDLQSDTPFQVIDQGAARK